MSKDKREKYSDSVDPTAQAGSKVLELMNRSTSCKVRGSGRGTGIRMGMGMGMGDGDGDMDGG